MTQLKTATSLALTSAGQSALAGLHANFADDRPLQIFCSLHL